MAVTVVCFGEQLHCASLFFPFYYNFHYLLPLWLYFNLLLYFTLFAIIKFLISTYKFLLQFSSVHLGGGEEQGLSEQWWGASSPPGFKTTKWAYKMGPSLSAIICIWVIKFLKKVFMHCLSLSNTSHLNAM